jgi:hypothetical protein
MTTYNTNNPVPSVDVRDLYDNAENLDFFSNGAALAYPDRLGVSRQSLAGIRAASAYTNIGVYASGLVFTSYNQTFSYLGDFYAPSAGIALPYTTSGAGAAEIATFLNVGDAVLRSDLSAASGAGLVGYGLLTVEQGLNDLGAFTIQVPPGGDVPAAIAEAQLRGGAIVQLLPGTHVATSTWVLDSSVDLRGAGGTKTIVYRSSAYGDTIYQETGFARISGIFFQHGTLDAANPADLNFRLTDGSAHIRLKDTQDSLVRDCIGWRMPYGLVTDGGHNTRIENCWFTGVWDKEVLGKQEGLADIYFAGTSRYGQLGKVLNCYLSGSAGPTRSTTFTDGVNSVSVLLVSNIGSKSNMLVESVEDLDISGTYFGRASFSLLHFTPNNIVNNVRVTNCFFDNAGDGAEGRQILVDTLLPSKSILGLSVTGNTFNGEYDTNNAFYVSTSTADNTPTVINLAFTGNTLFAHTAAPIVLFGVGAGSVTGNTITNWNSVGAALISSTNSLTASPVYVGPVSYGVIIQSNALGGGGNNAGDVDNKCYMPVVIDQLSVACGAAHNIYNGIVSAAGIRKGLSSSERIFLHNTSGNFQLVSGFTAYIRSFAVGSTSLVALPVYPVAGSVVIIKDGKGDAATNALVISTTDSTLIDGAANINMIEDFGFRELLFDGLQWRRIG